MINESTRDYFSVEVKTRTTCLNKQTKCDYEDGGINSGSRIYSISKGSRNK